MILASKSKPRLDLFRAYSSDIKVIISEAEEYFDPNLSVDENLRSVVYQKYLAVKQKVTSSEFTIALDTVIVNNKEIYLKPLDYNDAFRMLKSLNQITHQVLTAVCFDTKDGYEMKIYKTNVEFTTATDENIKAWLKQDNYLDKASGYSISDVSALFGAKITGSFTNIIGVPLDVMTDDFLEYYDFSTFTNLGIVGEIQIPDVTRVTTRAIVKKENKFGFITVCRPYFSSESFLESPGGGCYINDDLEQNLQKELLEELGAKVGNIKKLGVVDEYACLSAVNPILESYSKLTRHCFFTCDIKEIGKSNLTVLEKEQFLGIEFYSKDELLLLLNDDKFISQNIRINLERDLLAFTSYLETS